MVRNIHPELRAARIAAPTALTQAALSALERQVDQALLTKPELVVLNVASVESVESSGLEWIILAQSRLAAQGIQFVLERPSPLMLDVLLATRLDSRLHVDRGEEEGKRHA